MQSLGKNPCNKSCKVKWVKGTGSFEGYKLFLCKEHQIIHKMEKITPTT